MAKRNYSGKQRNKLSSRDSALVLKGLKDITNYKISSPSTLENQQLADDFNYFYCRFGKTHHTSPEHLSTQPLTPPAYPLSEHLSTQPLTPPATPLSPTPALEIMKMTCARSSEKTKEGKHQDQTVCHQPPLKPVVTSWPPSSQIFSTDHWSCAVVPAYFKCFTIIPVPNKPQITGLNDYRPVPLTSMVIKSFERLVLAYLKACTRPLLDPLQFAYRANRSMDDAVNMGLHFILQNLDRPGTYVRIPTSISQWITSFLTDRQQVVRLGKLSSSTRTISTGAPQGCVLSPLLFSLYTNDCTSKDPSVKLLKFADDTTLIGLTQDGDKSAYRQEVKELAVWCSLNNLELNMLKTVEMIVNFRRNRPALPPLSITNSTVTAVESFRFLGTTISQDLKWDNHIESIVKKGPAEAVLPSPAEEFQPATGAADTVLLCHH